MRRGRKFELVGLIGAAAVIVLVFLQCLLWAQNGTTSLVPTIRAPLDQPDKLLLANDYVGEESCQSCHQEKFKSYLQTAHNLTSRPANRGTVSGSFETGQNIFQTSNPELQFKMEATERGLFETAIMGVSPDTTSRSEQISLVIGSGRKGQTYLYWKNDELYQLPVSYWTELGRWVNSPGYRDGFADFSRRVPPRCLECHATYFKALSPPVNRFERSDYLLGLTCEKCHGPGRAHVEHYRAKTSPAVGNAIVNPAKLSTDRQVDLCALCHAGLGEPTRAPAFSFVPGQSIAEYLTLQSTEADAKIDVHGSQVELLRRSRCFRESKGMTCSTCHDVHLIQRDASTFSNRCLNCHKAETCGVYKKLGASIAKNCVNCHMPKQETQLIVSDSNGTKVRPQVRNHEIGIYPNALP